MAASLTPAPVSWLHYFTLILTRQIQQRLGGHHGVCHWDILLAMLSAKKPSFRSTRAIISPPIVPLFSISPKISRAAAMCLFPMLPPLTARAYRMQRHEAFEASHHAHVEFFVIAAHYAADIFMMLDKRAFF